VKDRLWPDVATGTAAGVGSLRSVPTSGSLRKTGRSTGIIREL